MFSIFKVEDDFTEKYPESNNKLINSWLKTCEAIISTAKVSSNKAIKDFLKVNNKCESNGTFVNHEKIIKYIYAF